MAAKIQPQWQRQIIQWTLAASNAELLTAVFEECWPTGDGEDHRKEWSYYHKRDALMNRLKKTGFLPEDFDARDL